MDAERKAALMKSKGLAEVRVEGIYPGSDTYKAALSDALNMLNRTYEVDAFKIACQGMFPEKIYNRAPDWAFLTLGKFKMLESLGARFQKEEIEWMSKKFTEIGNTWMNEEVTIKPAKKKADFTGLAIEALEGYLDDVQKSNVPLPDMPSSFSKETVIAYFKRQYDDIEANGGNQVVFGALSRILENLGSKRVKKIRKSKPTTLVRKIAFLPEAMGARSVNKLKLVGASRAWVLDIGRRTITLYEGNLSVKGVSITSNSATCKKVRENKIAGVLKAIQTGKREGMKAFDDIKAKPSPIRRITSDKHVLVRVDA